ncbi:MAG: hypothetical protein M1813_006514 [Trichoglossum hirsutum]|nr:MAG: hypothetical protein M1813_006514 [Trichoglossum hirsutum]
MGIDRHPSYTDFPGQPRRERWAKDRKFNPFDLYGEDVDLNEVEVCHDEDWIYVACDNSDPCEHCGGLAAHVDSIIIAVDGACPNNGKAGASAAVGVFVGDRSKYGGSYVLNTAEPTNQKAELAAGIQGLETALAIQIDGIGGRDLGQVIIKADSEYMVKGMTDWIFKWRVNGYKTAKGRPVANASLFRRLEDLVLKLNKLNVEVLFWHVPRELNKDADRLANAGLRKGR